MAQPTTTRRRASPNAHDSTTEPLTVIRRADDRGHAEHGWLDSRHTFSFADYFDPAWMGFRTLRVINEDVIKAGGGFGTHPHRDMEILTYVLEGAIAHKDSLGTGAVIRPGEIQRMSAGTGIRHSEHSATTDGGDTHLLQIWIEPDRRGYEPSYEQRLIPAEERRGRLRLIASPEGPERHDGSVTIHQDARVYAGTFDGAEAATLALDPARHTWVQVARGTLELDGTRLHAGDGAALLRARELRLANGSAAEVLVFDLA